jgi:ferredoxin
MPMSEPLILQRAGLDALITELADRGYQVIGPRRREGAIVYEPVTSSADLPAGWGERQQPGEYRLVPRDDGALFGFTVGPQGWKRYLYPPKETLFTARLEDGTMTVEPGPRRTPAYAFLGVRACELAAIAVQDRVFMHGSFADSGYRERRERALLIAVNCAQAAATCFCSSMGTGPKAHGGYDLALTELLDAGSHRFLLETGSDKGEALVAALSTEAASEADLATAREATRRAEAQMGRQLDTDGLPELIARNREHPRWESVADRCLSCGNCTLVCPTCFCSSVEDTSDLSGHEARRERHWDSCFNHAFSYVVGGSVRTSGASRYRQWMSHKLSSWHDQFGTSGCVGCGRCITWCPVGIDITEEAAAIRATDAGAGDSHGNR